MVTVCRLSLDTHHPDVFALGAETTLSVVIADDHNGVFESTFWTRHGADLRRIFGVFRWTRVGHGPYRKRTCCMPAAVTNTDTTADDL